MKEKNNPVDLSGVVFLSGVKLLVNSFTCHSYVNIWMGLLLDQEPYLRRLSLTG